MLHKHARVMDVVVHEEREMKRELRIRIVTGAAHPTTTYVEQIAHVLDITSRGGGEFVGSKYSIVATNSHFFWSAVYFCHKLNDSTCPHLKFMPYIYIVAVPPPPPPSMSCLMMKVV